MKQPWVSPTWDRVGLPIVFLSLLVGSLYASRGRLWTPQALWTAARSLLFFYMIWKTIRQQQTIIQLEQIVITQGELAVQRLEERDQARLSILHSAEDYAREQQGIAETLRKFTETTTKAVTRDLAVIRADIATNTALTKQTGEITARHTETIVADLHALTEAQAHRKD